MRFDFRRTTTRRGTSRNADAPGGTAQLQAHRVLQWIPLPRASWTIARRVAAKVKFHAGKLFLRFGFILTNLETLSRTLVRFHNKRGKPEQWIKEVSKR